MTKVIPCHVYKSGNGPFVVAMEATDETMKNMWYNKYPVIDVVIPENIIEVTGSYDDIICASGFIKAGIVTKEELEAMNEGEVFPKFDNKDLSSWHKMAVWLIDTNRANGFILKPYPRDEYGYENLSNCYYLPVEHFKGITIPQQ